MKDPIVSLIVPLYNEEKYIENCIESLLKQDFSKEKSEWIFVDGASTDNTKEIISKYLIQYPNLFKLYDNPNRTVPYAMNIGINKSKGKYIIRIDAHADYKNDYIKKCIYFLENTDADNVGGVITTKSKGTVGEAISLMLSSKFGVGNSKFRTNGSSGYVDTVPFGAFKREIFEKVGLYDIRLIRNQDIELNYRIIKNGGKIYLSNEIKLSYYCRDTIVGLVKLAVKDGKWNIITNRLCPGSMRLRHFIPMLFLFSIVILPLLSIINIAFKILLIYELLLYFLLDFLFTFKCILKKKKIKQCILLFFLYPLFHITYGFGSLIGIFSLKKNKK